MRKPSGLAPGKKLASAHQAGAVLSTVATTVHYRDAQVGGVQIAHCETEDSARPTVLLLRRNSRIHRFEGKWTCFRNTTPAMNLRQCLRLRIQNARVDDHMLRTP